MDFKWEWCDLCQYAFIRCPYCKNNCCNGGTGKLPSGEECGCKEAYSFQDSGHEKGIAPKSEEEIKR